MSEEREERIRALLPIVNYIARRVHRMVPSARSTISSATAAWA